MKDDEIAEMDFRKEFTKETWPSDAQYAYGTETKDGYVIDGVHQTVHGFWYHATHKTTGSKIDELFQDEVVPLDSPRVLNTPAGALTPAGNTPAPTVVDPAQPPDAHI